MKSVQRTLNTNRQRIKTLNSCLDVFSVAANACFQLCATCMTRAALIALLTAHLCANALAIDNEHKKLSSNHLLIATAANFKSTLTELVHAYNDQQARNQVDQTSFNIVANSTGALYHQIRMGAPYDIFFAADTVSPKLLLNDDRADHYFEYALGQLAVALKPIIAAKYGLDHCEDLNQLELTDKLTQLFRDQQHNTSSRIVIANPRTAPYGMAAEEVIHNLLSSHSNNVKLDSLNLARAKNILHAQQLFLSTRAQIAFIAVSLTPTLKIDSSGGDQNPISTCKIPPSLHKPITQAGVLLTHGDKTTDNRSLARAFVKFLASITAQQIILDNGYDLPNNVSP